MTAPTWANPNNFPQASCISNQPIAELVEELDQYENLYAALVTRGLDYDLPALKALLNRPSPLPLHRHDW